MKRQAARIRELEAENERLALELDNAEECLKDAEAHIEELNG